MAFLVGAVGFGVVRRGGGFVRTVVTVFRVVVDDVTIGVFVGGIRWGCFVGAAIGSACVGVDCVVTVEAMEEIWLLAVVGFVATFVVLLTVGRGGRLVVTFGKLCAVGGFRCVVGFMVVVTGTVEGTVVAVEVAMLLELTGVSIVVASSS